jgi:hypothetical protein
MKTIYLKIFILLLVASGLQAQTKKRQVSDTIQISFLYNVTILFESPLVGEPFFGSNSAIINERVDANTLMIKVDGQKMLNLESSRIPNTNMLVKTSTGIYNFILTYNKVPNRTFITPSDYQPIHVYTKKETFEPKSPTNPKAQTDSSKMLQQLKELNKSKHYFSDVGIIDSKLRMKMLMTNIWVDSTYIYFKVQIENLSSIPYDINYFHYVTTYGKFTLKRASDPIAEKTPVYQLVNPTGSSVAGGKEFINIVCFEKFTLSKLEYFNIQVGEVNGARQISIPISRKELFEAKAVPKLNNN